MVQNPRPTSFYFLLSSFFSLLAPCCSLLLPQKKIPTLKKWGFRDLDRIQTCNLLSRNQMRYSVAPRGLVAGANIRKSLTDANHFFK